MSKTRSNKKIALVGNPNCGKTTIFNLLTGMNQKVGNFPGITVDKKSGFVQQGEVQVELIDLPGIYSIHPKSPDEIIVSKVLINEEDKAHPDAVAVILDASNLKRNLYLLTQISDLDIPMLIVLNMQDVADEKGILIDVEELSTIFSAKVLVTNAKTGEGVEEILPNTLSIEKEYKSNGKGPIGIAMEDMMLKKAVESFPEKNPYKLSIYLKNIQNHNHLNEGEKETLLNISSEFKSNESKEHLNEISMRYRFIQNAIERVQKNRKDPNIRNKSDKWDRILTHGFWGWLIFLLVFFLLFQAVFTISAFPTDWIDSGMGWLISSVKDILPSGLLSDFVADGILTGINGIVVFLPQIMILFGLITILEDSGYMARVSFLNDKLLSRFGMNGKSVVPIVGGFACAVPAIMAARNIQNMRQRLITIMITPLMSCSARLPVYVFLIAFLVEEKYILGFINVQGIYMIGLYLLGVIFSVIVSGILNLILKKENSGIFTLEMPSFKLPRWKNVWMTMLNNGKTFIREAGSVIVVVSMILWVLTSFGPGDSFQLIDDKFDAQLTSSQESEISSIELQRSSEKLEQSYAGIIGKAIEPAIEPLGFDWRTGIAILTSFAAREVFVGTMANIYQVDSDSENTIEQLQERLMNQIDPKTGKAYLSVPTAWSLIIFYVFALQCSSTVAVVKKETNGWKWPIIQFVSFTLLAWISSYFTYSFLT